ncbi:hypothetical protein A3SI_18719 [Nitritalea halalkaliphila LW7]|uniref:Uncharacterized protein n=1 Tax=Nitritalea halalkaliphila LW7 TaxID=1189621 RepID=I5BTY9_9BACT|nr:hypothetical protein A3SI_18719 [Nitritalea halalkaliphila LW7]
MPIEIGVWNISESKTRKITLSTLETENKLEDIIEQDISIISDDLMLIGRTRSTNPIFSVGEGFCSLAEWKEEIKRFTRSFTGNGLALV